MSWSHFSKLLAQNAWCARDESILNCDTLKLQITELDPSVDSVEQMYNEYNLLLYKNVIYKSVNQILSVVNIQGNLSFLVPDFFVKIMLAFFWGLSFHGLLFQHLLNIFHRSRVSSSIETKLQQLIFLKFLKFLSSISLANDQSTKPNRRHS